MGRRSTRAASERSLVHRRPWRKAWGPPGPSQNRLGAIQLVGHPDDWELGLCLWGPIIGQRQTVPRAELQAIWEVVSRAEGDLLIYTDHEAHTKTWTRKTSEGLAMAESGDLWEDIQSMLQKSGHSHTYRWVKAHTKVIEDIDLLTRRSVATKKRSCWMRPLSSTWMGRRPCRSC